MVSDAGLVAIRWPPSCVLLPAEPTYNRTRATALAWRARILSQKALRNVSRFPRRSHSLVAGVERIEQPAHLSWGVGDVPKSRGESSGGFQPETLKSGIEWKRSQEIAAAGIRLTMKLYGVASTRVDEVIELFPTRKQAEEAMQKVTAEAPELASVIFVEVVEIEEPSPI